MISFVELSILIFFFSNSKGDGMGISTVTAARILKGQLNGESGEEGYLFFDRFPFTALIKVVLGTILVLSFCSF